MISVVASIRVKEGEQEGFEEVALTLAGLVRENEPDCLYYALHRSEDPLVYVFVERYTDMDAIENHRNSAHFKEWGAKMGPHMDGRPDIMRLEEIEI